MPEFKFVKTKRGKKIDWLNLITLNAETTGKESIFNLTSELLGTETEQGRIFFRAFHTHVNQIDSHRKNIEMLKNYPILTSEKIIELLIQEDMAKPGGRLEARKHIVEHIISLIDSFIAPALIKYQEEVKPIALNIRGEIVTHFRNMISYIISIEEHVTTKIFDYEKLSNIIALKLSDKEGYKKQVDKLNDKISLYVEKLKEHNETVESIRNQNSSLINSFVQSYVCLSDFVGKMLNFWQKNYCFKDGDFFKKHEKKLKNFLLNNLKELFDRFVCSNGRKLIYIYIGNCSENNIYFKTGRSLKDLFCYLANSFLVQDEIKYGDKLRRISDSLKNDPSEAHFNKLIKSALEKWIDLVKKDLENDNERVIKNPLKTKPNLESIVKPINEKGGIIKNTEGTVGIVEEQKKSVSNGKEEEYSDTKTETVGSAIPKLRRI